MIKKSFISLDNLTLFREQLVADWITSTKRTWSSSKISNFATRMVNLEILEGLSTDYLNFSANLPDTVVRLVSSANSFVVLDIEYSFDRINWEKYTIGADITIPTNGKVYFRGDNETLCSYNILDEVYVYHTFEFENESLSTLEVEAHGNVNSLLSKVDFDQMREFTSSNIIDEPIRDPDMGGGLLQSSGSSLRGRDLDDLGDGDNNDDLLDGGDDLSGDILLPQGPTDIFHGLFENCTALTTSPLLPATTLASGCYDSMFSGCTSLTTAPLLPATTLVDKCYKNMFNGCTSLNSVTCLATDISAEDCTTDWLNNVAATGTFYKDANMSDWTTGTSGIPLGWTTSVASNHIQSSQKLNTLVADSIDNDSIVLDASNHIAVSQDLINYIIGIEQRVYALEHPTTVE